ncbi:MAG: hypothetical protein H7Y31_06990 [Chitinophagaceae bacterium]|nr:hypothetical protein [Chitinophagaceae bacterium]
MKKILLLISPLLFSAFILSAQTSQTDSLKVARYQLDSSKLSTSLMEKRAKLTALENDLEDALRKSTNADNVAKASAEENASVARKLNNDATDKKLTRKARKAAKAAQKEAKRARISLSSVEKVRKSIASLQSEIESDERKMMKFRNGEQQ